MLQRGPEALQQLGRLAVEATATKETLAQAAGIIRRATGSAEAMLVYAEDQTFIACCDAGDGPPPPS